MAAGRFGAGRATCDYDKVLRDPEVDALLIATPLSAQMSHGEDKSLAAIRGRPFVNPDDVQAVISQREVGIDVPSYPAGLKSALRQDPDVILLGELRDVETIETALVAAETGHLVLSTLHTLDAPETINRIVSVFEPHHQAQIRHQLARVLRASISQRLLPRADGKGRVLAAEVLVSTPYVRDCISDRDKTSLLASAIASGSHEYGMQSFDQAILALCQQQVVTEEEAARWVTNVEEFKMRLRGITPGSRPASGPSRFQS